MLADLPEKNIDAACQVAHAFSTHQVSMELDFYAAVDDLEPKDATGAGMLGTVEFNSSCFYRYANIDIDQLRRNLSDDYELTSASLEAFLKAFVHAIPTGKQNSMAAQNPPSLVMIVARDAGCWSLANAFLKPVRPSHERDLVEESVAAMDTYWARLTGMYGSPANVSLWIATTAPDCLSSLKNKRVENLNKLIQCALAAVREAGL
jgi:CRISPR system Cascade subunit CasC